MPQASSDSPDPKPIANLARLLTQLCADAAQLEPKIPPSLTRAIHAAQRLSDALHSKPS